MIDHIEVLQAMLNEEASRLSLQNYEREAIKAAINSLRQAPEVVAVIGECAEVQWLNGGPCQLPPGARLFAACAAKRPRKTSSKCTRNCDCVADCKHPDKATTAQAGAELPEPAGVLVINGQALRGFTADQMREMYRRAYAELARRGG